MSDPVPTQPPADPPPLPPAAPPAAPEKPVVNSLLDAMQDGLEYSSLLGVVVGKIKFTDELRRAINEIETLRKRPLICYVSNVLRAGDQFTSIELADDLPFSEMVTAVDGAQKSVDIFVVTPGGSGQQVSSFVHKLRPRFDDVAYIVPHMCMSAGTIWVCSGNDIIMDERGFLGPIDPQVRSREGQMLPAQALFTLLKKIQEEGQASIQGGAQPSWTNIQLLKILDPKELGNAVAATSYATQLVADYLNKYKFQSWTHHKSGVAVTSAERQARATDVAKMLSSHEDWKTHSHGIFREVLGQKLRIKISHPDEQLSRATRRLWALLYWGFENTNIQKLFVSKNYCLIKRKPTINGK